MNAHYNMRRLGLPALAAITALPLIQGCVATRDWVREHVEPVTGRVTQSENRINQTEGQISGLGKQIAGTDAKLGQLDGRIGQVDAKTEKALSALGNLRLERRLVVDMKDGATFASSSAVLPAQVRKEIDTFLSDPKLSAERAVLLVAGHTDSTGPDDYNYELGKRRADAVARYLITEKKIDPLRVVPVSYGETAPAADNATREGRAKNRRVEILVYTDNVTTAASTKP
jgi:outer membrane protein OmpA-like peptidoglycan-associated protein